MRQISWLYFVFTFCILQIHSQKAELDSLLSAARAMENDSLQITAYNKIAFEFIFKDVSKAKKIIEEGKQIALDHNFSFGIAQMTNTHGIYMDVIGKSDSANYYFSKALKLSREKKIPHIEAKCLNNLGMFHWNRTNYKEALAYFFDSLKMNEDLGNEKATANPLNNIGLIYLEMYLFEDALKYHRRALAIREKYGLSKEQVASLNNIGICLKSLGRLDEAIEVLNKGIQLAKSSGNYLDFYRLHDNLGNVFQLKGEFPKSLEAYLTALNAGKTNHSNIRDELSANNNVVALYNTMNEPRKALRHIEEGLRILKENPNLETFAIDIHLNRAETLFMLDRNEMARASLKRYVALQDSLFSETNAMALAEMETKYQSEKKEKEILVQRAQIAKNELELNKKNNLLFGSIALAFVLGLGGYLFYGHQRLRNRQLQKEAELKTALVKIEAQNSLQQQRLRISRDLHDNIGSQLTFIISSIDTLNYGIKNGEVKIKDQLGQLAFFAKNTINELRDTIWAMNKEAITFEDLKYRINLFIANANTSSNVVGFEFIVDSDIDLSYSFTASEGINLYRIIQEAVTNSLKYAFPSDQNSAQLISVRIYKSLHFFHLQITDNGSGFDMGSIEMGNGIKNMRKRAADINSELELHSEEQKGTSIKLKITVRHGKED